MAKRWTGRRVIGAAIALVIVGAIGGTVAMRIVKKINDAPGGKSAEVVVLEFSPADLARVDAQLVAQPGLRGAVTVQFIALGGVEFADGVDEFGLQLGDVAVQCAQLLAEFSNCPPHTSHSTAVR